MLWHQRHHQLARSWRHHRLGVAGISIVAAACVASALGGGMAAAAASSVQLMALKIMACLAGIELAMSLAATRQLKRGGSWRHQSGSVNQRLAAGIGFGESGESGAGENSAAAAYRWRR